MQRDNREELTFMKKNIVHFIRKKLKVFYRNLFWKFIEKPAATILYFLHPQKNRIVLDNFNGKGYGGNPMYIAEEIHKINKNIQLVWLVDNIESFEFPDYIKVVKVDSILGLYMRATARVWVDNIRHRHPVKKKESQLYLQTWHGSMGVKKIEKDAESKLPKEYIKQAKYDGQIIDAIIADNYLQEKIYKRSFWLNNKVIILRFGFPQNDLIENKKSDKDFISQMKIKFLFDDAYYYVLYAPTFRDDYSMDCYNLDFDRIISAFEKSVGKPTKIVLRLHPNVSYQKEHIKFSNNVLDGTDYPNIQELALVVDAVISDYSSTVFDFALLNKPAFICALDFEKYEESRGFIPEFFDLPFKICKSNDELIKTINNFRYDEYKKELFKFYQKYPVYGEGDSARKTAHWILNKICI